MHILDIVNPALSQWLYRMSTPNMRAEIAFEGYVRPQIAINPGGGPVFDTVPVQTVWDLTPYVLPGGVSISQSMPIVPGLGDNSAFTGGRMTVTLINPSTAPHLASRQDGGIISLVDIVSGELKVQLIPDGLPDRIPLFHGRIIGPPTERRGETVLQVRDVTFEPILNPVLFEFFPAVKGTQNGPQVSGWNGALNERGQFYNRPHLVQVRSDHFQAFAGAVTFDEEGDCISTLVIETEGNEPIDLRRIGIQNGAKPGRYTIEFTGATSYRLTGPGENATWDGSINQDFSAGQIDINRLDWYFPSGTKDGSRAVLSFQVAAFVWYGNPVSMAMTLIERAFLQNWGEYPGVTRGVFNLPVDWDAFGALEVEMKGYRVWASDTNPDNKVWELSGDRPLNCIQAAQNILNSVYCSLIVTPEGFISVTGPRIWDKPLHDLTTAEAVTDKGVTIDPPEDGEAWNSVSIQYAYNQRGNSYGLTAPRIDARRDPLQELNVMDVALPYYKAGFSSNAVEFWGRYLVRVYVAHPSLFSFDVFPNWHCALMPGDRFRLVSRAQPVLSAYVRVHSVPGKVPGAVGMVRAHETQAPEGGPFLLDSSAVGDLVY